MKGIYEWRGDDEMTRLVCEDDESMLWQVREQGGLLRISKGMAA